MEASYGLNNAGLKKLAFLKADYTAATGKPFQHFYCPFLFSDEETQLTQAHVINAKFRNSARRRTIQRKDVDNFFGTYFENDFLALQEHGKHKPLEVLGDEKLTKQLRPKVTFKGKEISYYTPKGPVLDSHSSVSIELDRQLSARIALKLDPSEMLTGVDADWQIIIEKDVRLPALVALLKAAHLTLFEILGYQYALSLGGRFLGYDVLGKFFLANAGKERAAVLKNAETHFREFVNLVRPAPSPAPGLKGTISDGRLFLCAGPPRWAFLVQIRTGYRMHAVLVPLLENADAAARFAEFLSKPAHRFDIKLMQYTGNRWEISSNSHTAVWPDANLG